MSVDGGDGGREGIVVADTVGDVVVSWYRHEKSFRCRRVVVVWRLSLLLVGIVSLLVDDSCRCRCGTSFWPNGLGPVARCGMEAGGRWTETPITTNILYELIGTYCLLFTVRGWKEGGCGSWLESERRRTVGFITINNNIDGNCLSLFYVCCVCEGEVGMTSFFHLDILQQAVGVIFCLLTAVSLPVPYRYLKDGCQPHERTAHTVPVLTAPTT